MNFIPAVSIPSKDGNKNYDIFSLLLSERIIFITGEINDELASLVISEMLYLEAISKDAKINVQFPLLELEYVPQWVPFFFQVEQKVYAMHMKTAIS